MLKRSPRIEDRLAAVPRIHHDAHALDGQRGLGDGRRQHHLPLAGTARRDGAALLVHREQAVQRADVRLAQRGAERLGAAADLALTGQEGQDIAVMLFVCHPYGSDRGRDDIFSRRVTRIADVHRKHLSFTGDKLCAQRRADLMGINGRGHQRQPEVRS